MTGIYDEVVERLRKTYDLDLTEVFNSSDLQKEFGKLKSGGGRENLINSADIIFETDAIEKEVDINKANKEIEDIKNASDLIVIGDFSSIKNEERGGETLSNKFDDKAFDIIPNASKNELNQIQKVRHLIDNTGKFDPMVVERENELRRETPEELSKQELIDLGATRWSLRTAGRNLGKSQDDAREFLEGKGFTIGEDGRIRG